MKIPFLIASLCFLSSVAPGEASSQRVVIQANQPDATEAIAAALAKVGEAGGGEVYLPAGTYRISQTIRVPSGVKLRGETKGATKLLVPNGVTFALLLLDGVRDVTIQDLSLVEDGVTGRNGRGPAISINNGSRFITIEHVATEGFSGGFSVGRADQSECQNLVFRGCRAEKSRSFGFDFNNCREVRIDECYAYENWLDGFKFRKKTRDITIRGGESSYNGVSQLVKGNSNGNGVDAFAGGEAFTIDGLVTEHNQGSGIYMKTGTLNEQGFGVVGNAIITNVRCRYNVGGGLDINRSGGDLTTAPLLTNVTVVGGIYEGNTGPGIYVRARNVAITAPIVKGNGTAGILLSTSWNIDIESPIVIANSQQHYGRHPGIMVGTAQGVRISGGIINGYDGDEPEVPKQAAAHGRGIIITANAADVEINDVVCLNWALKGDAIERKIKR